MTAEAELAVAHAGSPPPGAVLEVLEVAVLVLGPGGQLVSANAAARRLLEARMEEAEAEELLRALAHEAWQADAPMERELDAAGPHAHALRARVTPLEGGAAVELAVAYESAELALAARLAQRIRDDSTRLLRVVGGPPGPTEPEGHGASMPARAADGLPDGGTEGGGGTKGGGAGAGTGPDPERADLVPPATARTGRLSAQDVTLDVAAHTVWVRGRRVALPFKEFEVLRLLLEQAGRVVPRQRLIERVWGRDFSGDPKTLDVHVKRLRAKIEVDRARPTRIVTVRQIGYRFDWAG
jgi:DNA-binding response OmpR family regulator